MDIKVTPHKSVVALLANGHHLPLTLCTTAALRLMGMDQSKVKYQKQYDNNGVRKELMDASTWPNEAHMSKEDWRNGYDNFLSILKGVAHPKIVEVFPAHYV